MSDIYTALAAVMADCDHVAKRDRNEHQRFLFRGIDAVVNAVSAHLIEAGVVVGPSGIRDYHHGSVEVGRNRTPMGHVTLVAAYTFTAPDGSSLVFEAPGEAMDSGDKATPKAMSVAYRTALLQALTLPTNEPDPDATSYERTDTTQVQRAKAQVWAAWKAKGNEDSDALAADFAQWSGGYPIGGASAPELDKYRIEKLEPKS